ncbi:hypothetical protein EC973_006972 [Apophysomyces ossiformis]|uniref:TRAF-type domain-containing protein n=1 Tax=Apophysomyces ossiformis TaxID=679940 RepID=A0A8H7BQC6_9FUNG|nr:hypothetical protein EC973_006972 [Apophysomyces ossiformis]
MDLEKHKSECDYELLSCPNAVPDCEPFLRKDLSEHESRCQFYPCAYAAEGCSFVGTLVDVKAHCDRYCGKLHQRLQQLEEECERLKHLLSQHNISYDTDAMQYSPSAEDKEGPTKASNENQMMNLTNTDLLSMFDDSLFSFGLDGNMNGFLGKANYCNDISTNILPISSTIGASTVSNPGTQSSGALPLPKRSSNGKLIRYNKNVRMAHNALRLARQKANLDDLDSADMDAILGDFDWLKPGEMRGRTEGGDTTMNNPTIAPIVSVDSPTSIELANLMSQQTLSSQSSAPSPPPSLPFSNLDDVTKFLAACPNGMDHAMAKTTSSSVGQLAVGGKLTSSPLASPIKEFTPSLARSQTSKQKADNHSNTALLRAKKNTTTKKKDNPGRISQALNTNNSANASTTTTPAATTTPTTTPTTTTSTNRPMFVLASSYLTNYK